MTSNPIINRNIVKLDTNIDGHYIDINGEYKIIENMIQVVSGQDGVDSYPISGSDFTESELVDITDVDTVVSYKGHGILYDVKGKKYAHKGQMVLRDGKGNKSSISDISNKVTTINQRRNLDTYLRDYTLNQLIDTNLGISLDQLILNTQVKLNPFGTGNIIQAVRNSGKNKQSVSVFTVPLGPVNHVWVVGKACVRGEAIIQLIDITTNTVLDTSYAKTVHRDTIVPVFCSYAGTLTQVTNPVNTEKCDRAIYNSFFKRYFKGTDKGTTDGVHEIAIVVVSSRTLTDAEIASLGSEIEPSVSSTIDVLVTGPVGYEKAINGKIVVRDEDNTEISFDTNLPDTNYSVILETEDFVRKWYESKSIKGFKIKLENKYTGTIFWSVIYTST